LISFPFEYLLAASDAPAGRGASRSWSPAYDADRIIAPGSIGITLQRDTWHGIASFIAWYMDCATMLMKYAAFDGKRPTDIRLTAGNVEIFRIDP
jgi:hypothetical protein